MTALQSLSLSYCAVEPEALAACTQLRALSLVVVWPLGASRVQDVVLAVSQLSLLTELCWNRFQTHPGDTEKFQDLTALTTSTNLCSLQLLNWDEYIDPQGCVLFRHDVVYPQLRNVTLRGVLPETATALSRQQLQELRSCCPAVDSLSLEL
jgi:hypothetical protein